MLISVEVRLRLTDSCDNVAMLVRGNEQRRSGKRVLIPFGGSMRATTDELHLFALRRIEMRPGHDMQFSIADESAHAFASLLSERLGGQRTRACREAKRELVEEAVVERRLLTKAEVDRIKLVYGKTIFFKNASFRHDTRGRAMIYVVSRVDAVLPSVVLDKLISASQSPNPQLEFIPPALLRNERGDTTERGGFVPPVYRYLL